MKSQDKSVQRTAWLYTRGEESVRLDVRTVAGGFQLAVFGPGNAATEFDFTTASALRQFHEAFEKDLINRGFALHASVDRRSGAGREGSIERDRRRQSFTVHRGGSSKIQ